MKNLDFPKGKANQNEADIDCAIREIFEEIELDVSKVINPNKFVKMQTLRKKWVTLYFVKGIKE